MQRYPGLLAYGQYATQLKPYFDAFGRKAVLPVFFDRLIVEPQMELERICRFIGYEGEPVWSQALKPSNKSSERIRRFPLYEWLVESSPATRLRRLLIPKSLRQSIKARFTMSERPVLGPAVRKEVEAAFDQDLVLLGEWLGVTLSCRNFKDITGVDALDWV